MDPARRADARGLTCSQPRPAPGSDGRRWAVGTPHSRQDHHPADSSPDVCEISVTATPVLNRVVCHFTVYSLKNSWK